MVKQATLKAKKRHLLTPTNLIRTVSPIAERQFYKRKRYLSSVIGYHPPMSRYYLRLRPGMAETCTAKVHPTLPFFKFPAIIMEES